MIRQFYSPIMGTQS